jgi:putative salt-induced outer membrane protein YdiY
VRVGGHSAGSVQRYSARVFCSVLKFEKRWQKKSLEAGFEPTRGNPNSSLEEFKTVTLTTRSFQRTCELFTSIINQAALNKKLSTTHLDAGVTERSNGGIHNDSYIMTMAGMTSSGDFGSSHDSTTPLNV